MWIPSFPEYLGFFNWYIGAINRNKAILSFVFFKSIFPFNLSRTAISKSTILIYYEMKIQLTTTSSRSDRAWIIFHAQVLNVLSVTFASDAWVDSLAYTFRKRHAHSKCTGLIYFAFFIMGWSSKRYQHFMATRGEQPKFCRNVRRLESLGSTLILVVCLSNSKPCCSQVLLSICMS